MDGRRRHRIRPHRALDRARRIRPYRLPAATVPFPTAAVVNAQTIGVRQAMNLFKLGVNYKFNLAMLTASGARN
jgi:hypothetical protein